MSEWHVDRTTDILSGGSHFQEKQTLGPLDTDKDPKQNFSHGGGESGAFGLSE